MGGDGDVRSGIELKVLHYRCNCYFEVISAKLKGECDVVAALAVVHG